MRKMIFAAALLGAAGTTSAQLINEFQPNPSGQDPSTVDFELLGTPGASFSGWVLSVEADDQSSAGTVDRAAQVSGTFDANGILNVQIPDLENPSFTVMLTSDFTGATGIDYDTDDDGMFDSLSDFGTIYDAIGSPDFASDTAANSYAVQVGGTAMAYIGSEPVNVFRDGTSGALYAVDFNGDVFDTSATVLNAGDFDSDPTALTFGAVNPSLIPAPASAALLGLGGLAAARRRR